MKASHHPKNLQIFRIESGISRVHRQQGDTGCQLQAFNRTRYQSPAMTMLPLMAFGLSTTIRSPECRPIYPAYGESSDSLLTKNVAAGRRIH
ncbi:hypothetical protein KCP69_26810 (plasmid) [Salmonella enterica subsp. enterica]|nr:hypothetical protein KCP69_26810 [Salmonella enterica subsp. enterica]